MKISRPFLLIVLAIIVTISILAIIFLPQGSWAQQLMTLPLVGTLFAALMGVLRDEIEFTRRSLLESQRSEFELATASHMAIVVFDKHVEFCQLYVSAVSEMLSEFYREGPTERGRALEHASRLFKVRRDFAIWTDSALDDRLESFEARVRELGAGIMLINNSSGDNRRETVKNVFLMFAQILGPSGMQTKEWEGSELTEDKAVGGVIRSLRSMLGVNELVGMRKAVMSRTTSPGN